MVDTRIEWATKTWNPIVGCTPVSAGCASCWAILTVERLASNPGLSPKYDGLVWRERSREGPGKPRWNRTVRLFEDRLDEPVHWRKQQRVFVVSQGDLFHPDVPDDFIAEVWDTMMTADQHKYLVLTKRPLRMRDTLRRLADHNYLGVKGWKPNLANHVWCGVSVENQATADERIPILLDSPCAHRWVSAEPLLDGVDLSAYVFDRKRVISDCVYGPVSMNLDQAEASVGPSLEWVVDGCESGPWARPDSLEWHGALLEQCASAGVPYFLKQMRVDGDGALVKMPRLNGKVWDQYPQGLRLWWEMVDARP